jgi:hypothetical protein
MTTPAAPGTSGSPGSASAIGRLHVFEVGHTHIDALVTAALRDYGGGPMTWHHGLVPGETLPAAPGYPDTRRYITLAAAGRWGALLITENLRSLSHHRGRDTPGLPYEFTEITGRLDPVAILRTTACYERQSGEHPGWAASEARSFCQALRTRTIQLLPGYHDGPWDITSPDQVLARPF